MTWKPTLLREEIAHYLCDSDGRHDCPTRRTFDRALERYGDCTLVLCEVEIDGLIYNTGEISPDALRRYADLSSLPPPIFVIDGHIVEGNHRTILAKQRGKTHIWAYVAHGYTGVIATGVAEPLIGL